MDATCIFKYFVNLQTRFKNWRMPAFFKFFVNFISIYKFHTCWFGISTNGLVKLLDLACELACYLLVRICHAMQDRDRDYMLEGHIEMGEAFLGALKSGKDRHRGAKRKKGGCCLKDGDRLLSASAVPIPAFPRGPVR